jgi:hypothetical protein
MTGLSAPTGSMDASGNDRPAGALPGQAHGTIPAARAAGLRAAWVNRSAAPFDTIGARPDITVSALDRLPAALAA